MIVFPGTEGIEKAARRLRDGGLVSFPTETVYGLGADAGNGAAIARIFEAKGRPRFNPLIVHVCDLPDAQRIAVFDGAALSLAERFWPGPLTLVLPLQTSQRPDLSSLVTAGLETVALRIPNHPVALAFLRACAVPVAAPSANRSGHLSATEAAHVHDDLGNAVDTILDGGPAPGGIESTIVMTGRTPVLLRPGGVPSEEIESVLGRQLKSPDNRIRSPGQLANHYAPASPLRMNARSVETGETLLGFGPDAPADALNLSPSGDLREAAANLFAYLRRLDSTNPSAIAVMPIPEGDLGNAINDRLSRAAAGRT